MLMVADAIGFDLKSGLCLAGDGVAVKLSRGKIEMKALSYNTLFGGFYGTDRHDVYRHNTVQGANATVPMSDVRNTFRSDYFFLSTALLKYRNDYKGIINNEIPDKAFGYYRTWAEFALEIGK